MTRIVAAFVLVWSLTAAAQTPPASEDEHKKLPPGQGRELMIRVCSQCHSPDSAADQQLDRAGWKSLVDQMAEKGAMATESEFHEIVQYLAEAFPAIR
jgi:competence protein ComEA